MEIPTKTGGGKLSTLWRDLGWRKWLLALLFPIPMGSWWLTLIWAGLFCLLLWFFIKNPVKNPKLPPKLE